VGNGRKGIPLQNSEIDFLRAGCCRKQIEPYNDLVIGEKVRIRNGVMQGVQGTLVRKNSSMKFVLTLELINQNAAIEVDADCLEPVVA
jgi:transcription antitermination factor NusG